MRVTLSMRLALAVVFALVLALLALAGCAGPQRAVLIAQGTAFQAAEDFDVVPVLIDPVTKQRTAAPNKVKVSAGWWCAPPPPAKPATRPTK